MSNPSIDNNRSVRDAGNKEIGKADYSGQVRDGYRDKGKIENGRYIDENGTDQGWVKKSSGSGTGGGLGMIVLLLIFGIYYLMYLGIKWLIVEGKKSLAHASRSWGITSILLCPLFFLALIKGYAAIDEIDTNGGPSEQKSIAKAGIVLGYIGGILFVMLIFGTIKTATWGY
jgi:hypothetical protein